MAPGDVPKTAITTLFDLFEFLRIPFGLRNAEPDESLILMSSTSPTSSNPSFDKQSYDRGDLPISRALCGKNKALSEELMIEKNFQK